MIQILNFKTVPKGMFDNNNYTMGLEANYRFNH